MSDETDRLYAQYLEEQLELSDQLPDDPAPDMDLRTSICASEGHFIVKILACRYCGEAFGLEQDPAS